MVVCLNSLSIIVVAVVVVVGGVVVVRNVTRILLFYRSFPRTKLISGFRPLCLFITHICICTFPIYILCI